MIADDSGKRVLAAGFVTATLSEAEVAEAEILLASDADFANLVRDFRALYEAEGANALPESVWQGIERRLTGRRH